MNLSDRLDSLRVGILAAIGLTPIGCGPEKSTTVDETGVETTMSATTTTAAPTTGGSSGQAEAGGSSTSEVGSSSGRA